MSVKQMGLLGILLCLVCVFNLSYADSLDTQLSQDKVALGETFTLSFTLKSNAGNVTPDFSPLEKDFHVVSTDYGTAVNMINGVTTTQTFWYLTLDAKTIGTLTIPEINFGNTKSPPRQVLVEPANTIAKNEKTDASTFVEASVSSTTPYIQSQLIYTLKIFYQSQLENPNIEFPQIKDVTMVQLGEGNNYQTTIKGKPYEVVEKKLALFPQKSGKITIAPARFRAMTYDVNSSMVTDPFYTASPKRLALATQAFTLNVQKIPDSYQGSTWLPASDLVLTENWSVNPNQWEMGNPVTRTITVTATGLRADQIPDLTIANITGVNIYVDPPKRSNTIQNDAVVGVLEQKVTYIPSSSQSFAIPPVKLAWWNLQTKAMVTAELNSIVIHAKGNIVSQATDSAVNTKQVPVNSAPAAPASTMNSAPGKSNPLFYQSIWFWIAGFFLLIWMLTLAFFWRQKNPKIIAAASNPLVDKPIEITEQDFKHACEQGDAASAQQFLLTWAKKSAQTGFLNLEQLWNATDDANFKEALKMLEQAIYAKKPVSWNGSALFAAFQVIKKRGKSTLSYDKRITSKPLDPLPPLNPSS